MPRLSRRRFLESTAAAGLSAAAVSSLVANDSSKQGCPPEVRRALSGPWPSIRTPFTRQGEIDYDAVRRNVDFVIAAKAKAVVLTHGDSLFSVLSDEEIAQLTKVVVQQGALRICRCYAALVSVVAKALFVRTCQCFDL